MDADRAPHFNTETSQDADSLVNRTAHFVGEWINEHREETLTAIPNDLAAESLAERCIADAASEGIMAEDITEEVGDLKEYIAKTVLAQDGSTSAAPVGLAELLPSPREKRMPKFRFEFIESTDQPAIQVEMESLDAARAEAKRAAKEAMLDGIVEGMDPTSWVTKIYDEAGYLVTTIGFQDLVHASPSAGEATEEAEEPGVMRSG